MVFVLPPLLAKVPILSLRSVCGPLHLLLLSSASPPSHSPGSLKIFVSDWFSISLTLVSQDFSLHADNLSHIFNSHFLDLSSYELSPALLNPLHPIVMPLTLSSPVTSVLPELLLDTHSEHHVLSFWLALCGTSNLHKPGTTGTCHLFMVPPSSHALNSFLSQLEFHDQPPCLLAWHTASSP